MKATVQFIRQGQLINPNGAVSYYYTVTFMVGDHGPFTIQFNKEEFTPANVQAKLAQFASSVQQITAG